MTTSRRGVGDGRGVRFDALGSAPTLLVLRALGVGDLATAVPALRGLRAAYPDRLLALAAPRWLAPLVDVVGGVDALLPVGGLGDWETMAVEGAALGWGAGDGAAVPPAASAASAAPGPTGPALAVNLHGRGPQSHHLLRLTGPDRLLAFACPEAAHTDGPRWRADEHEVARWCRLLHWYGLPADPGDLALLPPPGRHPTGLTIVHPGAKSPARRWPVRRYGTVARALAEAGHRVVVTGSLAERDLAVAVADAAGLPEPAVMAGNIDVGDLAGIVAGARLVISGDTGVAHLATGYGIPSVVLFAKMSPALWGPPPDRPWHRVLWRQRLADHPGGYGAHPALLAIEPDEVLSAATDAETAATHRYCPLGVHPAPPGVPVLAATTQRNAVAGRGAVVESQNASAMARSTGRLVGPTHGSHSPICSGDDGL